MHARIAPSYDAQATVEFYTAFGTIADKIQFESCDMDSMCNSGVLYTVSLLLSAGDLSCSEIYAMAAAATVFVVVKILCLTDI